MIIEAENPWDSCGIALRVNIIPGTLLTQALAEGPSRVGVCEACHSGSGEDLLDPEGAQELGPNGTDEFSAMVGEEPARCAKIGNNMVHKGFADCIGGMVAGGDEDGIFREAIHEDNQELVAVVQQCQLTVYPRGLGTEWCRSSSGDGRSLGLIGLGTTLSGL